MAAALGMDVLAFTERYTRLAADRRALALNDRADGACILLDEQGRCRVHAVKPQQCRDFPMTWHTPGYEAWCAGMGGGSVE